jgi:hypothetical protein
VSLAGARGIVRASRIPNCARQAAMVVEHVKELEFYRSLVGEDFRGEYGERVSARRRGAAFERAAFANDAAQLKAALAPRFGYQAEDMWTRNFADEIPGPPTTMRAARLHRLSLVFRDLAAGKRVPELLIQPQLRIPIRPDVKYYEYIAPDFMVLDPGRRIYVPGELKSFAERDGVASRADLDLPRRQAGVQVIALTALADRVGIEDRVDELAVFVYATPFGLKLGPPHLEEIRAECREIRRAITQLASVHARLRELRAVEDTTLVNLIDEFPADYQEACHGTCILAGACKEAAMGTARELGDEAREMVGPDMPIQRLIELSEGAAPMTPLEAELAPALQDAATVLDALAARRAA